MKTLKNAVVDSIITDLQKQRRSDRTAGVENTFYVADVVRISFNEYLMVKVYLRGSRWYITANISVDNEDGRTVAENTVDFTLVAENGKQVPQWGHAAELLRDTIGDRIRY